MTSTRSSNNSSSSSNDYDDHLIEEMAAAMLSTASDGDVNNGRRSRTSIEFFQRETSNQAAASVSEEAAGGVRRKNKRSSFLGLDGKVQDNYIAKRASLNKPDNKITFFLDYEQQLSLLMSELTKNSESITRVDGNILSSLLISGYARLGSKVDELNRINVFPIADGDTGANMKVCLKLPARNLLLDPSSNILRVASNMAADVLLNGQGNSGTILSHFYVSLAEEISETIAVANNNNNIDSSLSIDEFAACIARTGEKMHDAVPNPQEGTIISVCRDSCSKLLSSNKTYSNLKELLRAWNDLAQIELKKTPDQLVVDGVKVLDKAGVVDSGAQGFAYIVEGMMLASEGKLPEACDPNLFKTGVKGDDDCGDDVLSIIDDHNVCDTKYQYCTEAVILLKDDCTKKDVMTMIENDCDGILGDSVACVGAPAKEGGHMCKVHIHTNEPQQFYDKLLPFSRSPILKKEKVEDMKIMRELEHGSSDNGVEGNNVDLSDAKFTILTNMSKPLLPSPERDSEDLFAFPLFLVPNDTEEPIDYRYVSDTDACVALNKQRNESTAVKYTTAASNPMQMKIELLSAIGKGKPVLVFISTLDKKYSSFGRNLLEAIDMLDPNQKDMVRLYVHGTMCEPILVMEAIRCAKDGKTIDETHDICEDVANRTVQTLSFQSSKERKIFKAWRPALFPDEIIDGTVRVCGSSGSVALDGCPVEKRIPSTLMGRHMAESVQDAYQYAIQHIKNGLKPGQKVGCLLIPCVGRPDNGKKILDMMLEAGIEIDGTPRIYNEGILGVMKEWGGISLQYKIIE